jgi:F-type H+-transporting ATPase subunit b|tara:strand:+ start:263 stop:742 length:480 start_codon:yes stop_codon:yes gene_type:complete
MQDPTFWVLIAFIIFIGLAARPIYKLACSGLDKRADKIRTDFEEAEALRKEAQDLLASYQRKQRDAITEVEDILQLARKEAERFLIQGQENIKDSIERRRRVTLERIEYLENQALESVRAKTINIALNITREFLVKELKGKQADILIDSAIKDLPKKLH